MIDLLLSYQHEIGGLQQPTDAQLQQAFAKIEPQLMEFSKCRDYVVNKGHYFGTSTNFGSDMFPGEPGLSDADKNALIEFLKTF